jgi:hypothetical protein
MHLSETMVVILVSWITMASRMQFVPVSIRQWCTDLPSDTPTEDGDIVSLDIGVVKNGFWGDSAYTFGVGQVSPEFRQNYWKLPNNV